MRSQKAADLSGQASDMAQATASDERRDRPALTEPIAEAWYCIGESRSFKAGQLRSVQVCGEQIVVARRDDGGLRALRDRCAHRGMALSKGTFKEGLITCPFHGWQFTVDGACAAIPALSASDSVDVGKIRIRSFDVVDHLGMVWLKPGGGSGAPALPDIDFEPAGPPLAVSVEVNASFDLSVLSLVDPAHVAHVHTSWWWRTSRTPREKVKQFEPSPHGFTMRSHQAARAALMYRLLGGIPDVEIEFRLPGVRLERIAAGKRRFANYTFVTPVADRKAILTNVMYWNWPLLNLARYAVRPLVRQFLNQDRDVLEIAQRGLDRQPTMILLGESDLPGQWYFGLKREFLRSSGAGSLFLNPLESRELRWRS
ncbi:phenylpropionate dioxygenase-like ring-hydroxylating dioxygenase large terminal subunit [Labrys wisconsinensis]|uniref:Phenylpropionate dioxygenase-like ring-hydroxylating dioxygenase large terminal subunit n=2 Tax=Labrys wisconsinensis TaxID=425677 RepID=A0ABU0JLA0_9HYPH|nr:phenylpropionate dioxygenase-like ring-hydroxylating dioxygenase large terminal subunit [Labrys wisconsinensis]